MELVKNTMTKHTCNIKSCPTSQHCHLAICWIYSRVYRNAITNTPFVTKIHLFNVIAIAYISVFARKSSWVVRHAKIEQVFMWMTVQEK